jgi:hypothetical protein
LGEVSTAKWRRVSGLFRETAESHTFCQGSLIRRKNTNEDAKVVKCFFENGVAIYEVQIPLNRYGWQMGAVTASWEDRETEPSQNESL